MILCSSAKGNYCLCLNATQAERSNRRHRPIGIGVQGLADAFILMRYPFESPEAQRLNQQIFETIYYGALEASCELAKEQGPYETYEGSPVSKGVSTRNCPVLGPKQIMGPCLVFATGGDVGLKHLRLLILQRYKWCWSFPPSFGCLSAVRNV